MMISPFVGCFTAMSCLQITCYMICIRAALKVKNRILVCSYLQTIIDVLICETHKKFLFNSKINNIVQEELFARDLRSTHEYSVYRSHQNTKGSRGRKHSFMESRPTVVGVLTVSGSLTTEKCYKTLSSKLLLLQNTVISFCIQRAVGEATVRPIPSKILFRSNKDRRANSFALVIASNE